MEKSRDAFRTISEVAEWLDVPTHVLRFWESRFSQIKPVKRAGGRRYYRPSDMRVIGGVKTLLHDQGMTIRGVQKLFREKGIKHISGHAPALHGEEDTTDITEAAVLDHAAGEPATPAPMARSTRDAAPDPIIDPAQVGEDDAQEEATAELTVELDEVEPIVEGEDAPAPEAEPVLQFTRSTSAPAEQTAPTPLEVSADVPLSDPSDDDADHPATPGIVARLRVTPRETLGAHKDILAAAVDKLKALNARAS